LAEASGAIVIGFNVTSAGSARKAAEKHGVDVRFYDVIYDISDDVEKAVLGLLDPEKRLEILGQAEVRDVFKITKVGMIAGCYVTEGSIERNALVRVTRDEIVIESDRKLSQLKRFKDDAKEVKSGQECGMLIDGYDDIKVGDVLECYKVHHVQPGA
jgi:translation initiation factor IF-2